MKVLFMVESVTMAHPTRSFELATHLVQKGHQVVFAATESPLFLKSQDHGMTWVDLQTGISSKEFLQSLEKASLPYTVQGLDQALTEDLMILRQYQPDIIIGDMRLSLQVSARLSKTKWINLSNLVWNPETDLGYLMPEMPASRMLGSGIQHLIPRKILEKIIDANVGVFNQFRTKYGLSKLLNLKQAYCDGDRNFYLDLPSSSVSMKQNEKHLVIGPVLFSSSMEMPEWISELPESQKKAFVSMGSSGNQKTLEKIVHTLLAEGYIVILIGGSVKWTSNRLFMAPFAPVKELMQMCDLVVCNGGTPMTYLALSLGKAVLGIPSNMDQHLTMKHLSALPLVQSLRSEDLSYKNISNTVRQLHLIHQDQNVKNEMMDQFSRWNSMKKFVTEVESYDKLVDKEQGSSQVETIKNAGTISID